MNGKRAVLSALVAAVVACGGTTPATSGTASPTTAAVSTPSAAPATTAAATASPAATGANLTDLLSASRNATYKVTYKTTVSSVGTTEQTWYFKPPRSRFDFAVSQGGQTVTISYFNLPDGSFYCFNAGQVSCFTVAGVGSPLDQNVAFVAQRALIENPAQYGATLKETRTIAGQSAQCYEVRSSASAGVFTTGTFCYSSGGIPLFEQFATASAVTWSMEATNFSATVPDSDFTLPARP